MPNPVYIYIYIYIYINRIWHKKTYNFPMPNPVYIYIYINRIWHKKLIMVDVSETKQN